LIHSLIYLGPIHQLMVWIILFLLRKEWTEKTEKKFAVKVLVSTFLESRRHPPH
jgi:hypothetical protein